MFDKEGVLFNVMEGDALSTGISDEVELSVAEYQFIRHEARIRTFSLILKFLLLQS